MRWRTAMQLEEKDLFQSQARIMVDRDDRSLSLEVAGRDPRGLLSVLRKELEAIRASFSGLKMEEFVPIEGSVFVKYDTLLAHEKRKRKDYFCPELERDYTVTDLLDGIESAEMRSESTQMALSAFISYAHADEADFQALKTFKKAIYSQVRLNNVTLWDDGAILPGENWSNAIWQNFAQADLIICLLSPNFIISDFCYSMELTKALEAHHKGEKVIFPVRLIDCNYQDLEIATLQGAPSAWINPGQAGAPNHELWAELGRKFGELVKVMKERKVAKVNDGKNPF